jgi:tetrahydromethanopterin S-methyltransferase subunit B
VLWSLVILIALAYLTSEIAVVSNKTRIKYGFYIALGIMSLIALLMRLR